jgi:peptidoglycan/LPS O-acetylase OafA/YrhL
MKITSADYWAVKNDYKPLMHTWSLGIEEQFYLLYPVIFFFLNGDKKKFILPLTRWVKLFKVK